MLATIWECCVGLVHGDGMAAVGCSGRFKDRMQQGGFEGTAVDLGCSMSRAHRGAHCIVSLEGLQHQFGGVAASVW